MIKYGSPRNLKKTNFISSHPFLTSATSRNPNDDIHPIANIIPNLLPLGHPSKEPITSSDAAHVNDSNIAAIVFERRNSRWLEWVSCVLLLTAWSLTSSGLSSEVPPPLACLILESNETTATYNCLNARQYKAVIRSCVLRSKCINLIKHVSLSAISSLASFPRRDRCVKAPQPVIRNYVDETPRISTIKLFHSRRFIVAGGTTKLRRGNEPAWLSFHVVLVARVDTTWQFEDMDSAGSVRRRRRREDLGIFYLVWDSCTSGIEGTELTRAEHSYAYWSVSGQTSPEGILTGHHHRLLSRLETTTSGRRQTSLLAGWFRSRILDLFHRTVR
ncbi:hypothetical protein R3P38DRAFT_2786582 [Favolaschia claudopus]|uniref:Uncharacterized protein n=1 Tax=Favolaschia claudopus TaxID=2862362 RepID=A0AAW0ARG3_9AGAR